MRLMNDYKRVCRRKMRHTHCIVATLGEVCLNDFVCSFGDQENGKLHVRTANTTNKMLQRMGLNDNHCSGRFSCSYVAYQCWPSLHSSRIMQSQSKKFTHDTLFLRKNY